MEYMSLSGYKNMLLNYFAMPLTASLTSLSDTRKWLICFTLMQILTEEIVKEVENSITEFKRHNQDYDEGRVREQVIILIGSNANLLNIIYFLHCVFWSFMTR